MRTLLTFMFAAGTLIPAYAESSTPMQQAPELGINMPDGSQKLLSSYRGKPVCLAFFYTTCPHCQDMAKLLSSQIVPEYAPKGVAFIAAAFDPDTKTQTADFVKTYVKGFPMGYVERGQVNEFLQKSVMTLLYVPIMVFIDRKGTIQSEYIGDQTFLADPPKNVRAELDKLLARPAGKPVTHLSKK
jgi:cytochrome oxidase Cu insertion factor (SCO1/SenC/PrrC family)